MTGDGHALNFHHGEVLWRLSNTYDTLMLMIVEAVQNAIDAMAENVFVGIDIPNREVVIYDDGQGVTVEKFQQALLSVGMGIKDRKTSLGRFGLGMISPINKCRVFSFISQPVGSRNVFCWTFVGEGIRTQHERVTIPFEQRTSLPEPPSEFARDLAKVGARWRTVVHLDRVTEQKVVSLVDLDELEGHIRAKLGQGMLQKGTTIHVTLVDETGTRTMRTVDPSNFTGEPLEVVEYETEDTGKVRFELYRAPRASGKRRGRVLVMRMGDNRPIAWRDFQTQAMGAKWLKDVKEAFDALGSGYFEGIIHIEKVELDPSGSRFDTSKGDAVYGSYLVIQNWYDDHGRECYEEERTQRREERYRTLGEQSLARLLARLDADPVFAGMVRGLLGVLPEQDVAETEQQPDREPDDSGQKPRKRKRVRARVQRDRPSAEKTKPDTPRQPQDNPATFSISFAYDILPESMQLFEFDLKTGVLTFNILHPTWVALDETGGKHTTRNDRQIMALQEWIAFEVLFDLSQHGEESLVVLTDFLNRKAKFYAPLFISG